MSYLCCLHKIIYFQKIAKTHQNIVELLSEDNGFSTIKSINVGGLSVFYPETKSEKNTVENYFVSTVVANEFLRYEIPKQYWGIWAFAITNEEGTVIDIHECIYECQDLPKLQYALEYHIQEEINLNGLKETYNRLSPLDQAEAIIRYFAYSSL